MRTDRILAGAAALSAAAGAAWAEEDGAVSVSLAYTADVMGVVEGGLAQRGRFLDNLDVMVDADLERAFGWRGWRANLYLLNNTGGMPNEDAGTLQGIDNIEVSRHRARVYEAWIEKAFANKTLVRAGLYDLNSEFYANDAAGLLIAPAFGIGSEIAATGPNGPSIFPSTSLALRLDARIADNYYARAAILNASAGTLGDPDGVDWDFDQGALLIGEAGFDDGRKLALGYWRYSDDQADIRTGAPRTAAGGYLLAEHPLKDPDGVRGTVAFFRAGVSDGDTTPFRGGWQAGVLVSHVFESRPESAFSVGVNQGALSSGHRRNEIDAGGDMGDSEYALEITYADRLAPHVMIQPDLQFIRRPAGHRDIEDVLAAGLRVTFEL